MVLSKLAVLFLPAVLAAQTNSGWCEAGSQTRAQLKQITSLESVDGNRRIAQLDLLNQFLARDPDNLDFNLRYQQLAARGAIHGREDVIARYRKLAEQHPNSAVDQYLYASALVDTDTPQAIRVANHLLQTEPNFPRTHLLLASIYSWGKFADKPQARTELIAFYTACPASLNGQALGTLKQAADQSFAKQLASSLRNRLQHESNPELLQHWDTVWNLEFKANSPADYAQVRHQITTDLVHLTQTHPDGDAAWLTFLRQGYKLAGNPTVAQQVEAKLLDHYPDSPQARQISDEQWYKQHPAPYSDRAKWQAFQQANLQRTNEKLKSSPHNVEFLWNRFYALSELDGTTNDQLAAAADAFLAQYKKTPDFLFSPPPQLQIARAYLKRKFRVTDVPALVKEAETANLIFDGPLSDRMPETSRAERIQYEEYLAIENAYVLVDAARQLGKPEIANGTLPNIEKLKPEMPLAKVTQFQVQAKWAELQNHKLDALLFYRAALEATPSNWKINSKDALSGNVARLRQELGGTAASDDLWNHKPAQTQIADVTPWQKPTKAMTPWHLTDLHGKTWKLASFEGKTLLINIWATWCAPCRAEHPELQKLYDQLKSDPKIQIVTFNVDDEIGNVSPYMKDHRYTFPVLLAKDYVNDVIGSTGIPRNWIVDAKGNWLWEQLGFGDPKEWQSELAAKLHQSK